MVNKESCLCNSSAPPSSVKYLPTYQSIKSGKSGETPVVGKNSQQMFIDRPGSLVFAIVQRHKHIIIVQKLTSVVEL